MSWAKYDSTRTSDSRPAAAAASGAFCTSSQRVDVVVARHGFSRPVPSPVSSTRPYLASCRRWNEHVPDDSPSSRAACVAVSGPRVRSARISFIRTGCAYARSAVALSSRVTLRPGTCCCSSSIMQS